MKRLFLATLISATAAFVFTCAPAHAAQGGGKGGARDPIAFILSHSADLAITAEQKPKLDALEKEYKDARKGGKGADKAAGDKGDVAAKYKELTDKINAILTQEQQDKLKALHEKAGSDKMKKDDTK